MREVKRDLWLVATSINCVRFRRTIVLNIESVFFSLFLDTYLEFLFYDMKMCLKIALEMSTKIMCKK
jgi:hypothetical protein